MQSNYVDCVIPLCGKSAQISLAVWALYLQIITHILIYILIVGHATNVQYFYLIKEGKHVWASTLYENA